jgi:hypothetical protein
MRRLRLLLLLLLFPLSSCGGGDAPPPPPEEKRQPKASNRAAPPASAAPSPPARQPAGDAAAALRRYYDHIEAGRYEDAWAMRGGGGEGAKAFAGNFAGYERYRVTVGAASEPVAANGWSFVEVPIQIFGRMKGGEPFGSAGSVTMRRASGAPGATPRQRGWHIYTGG